MEIETVVYCPYCKHQNSAIVPTPDGVVFAHDLCEKCGELYSYDVEWVPRVTAFKMLE